MANLERKMTTHEVSELDLDCDTLMDAISTVNKLIDLYGQSAHIVKDSRMYDDSLYLSIQVNEPETDEEMATRINRELGYEHAQNLRDACEFARLNAKFGVPLS